MNLCSQINDIGHKMTMVKLTSVLVLKTLYFLFSWVFVWGLFFFVFVFWGVWRGEGEREILFIEMKATVALFRDQGITLLSTTQTQRIFCSEGLVS